MDPELLYYSTLDPFFHLKTALAIYRTPSSENFVRVAPGDEAPDKYEDYDLGALDKAAQIFSIRFHQAETLLTLFCAGNHRFPALKYVSSGSKANLDACVHELSAGRIPTLLDPIRKEFNSFDEYVEFSILRTAGKIENVNEYSLFITAQARLFSNRAAYNAVKHGCSLSGNGLHMKFSVEEEVDLFEDCGHPVTWMRWLHRREGNGFTIERRNIGISDHINSIAVSAMIVDAIKRARLGVISNSGAFSVNVINSFSDQTEKEFLLQLKVRLSESNF